MKLFPLLLVAALAGCATTSTEPPTHHAHDVASDKPEVIAFQVPLELAHHTPALAGPVGKAPSFTFACNTGVQKIKPPASGAGAGNGQGYVAIWVWVNSATPVYFGDSTVDSTGMPLCTASASCPRADQTWEAREIDCLSSSGTVNVNVQVAQP